MADLIALVGPTASGKTSLAVNLAQRLNGEIISADSMLVYKYMDIGTAKPTEKEMQGIPHYMIDLVTPDTIFTVYEYQSQAFECIDKIISRRKTPILVGGTGLYVQSVLDGYEFGPADSDDKYRQKLEKIAEEHSNEILHRALEKIDPYSAGKIHPNDRRRMIRAIEVFKATGTPISAQKKRPSYLSERSIRTVRIGLTMDREMLYRRIESRVDQMMEQGFIAEVEGLLQRGYDENLYSMQSLGYKQIVRYLKGEDTLVEAVSAIKKETRHFAKRQYTWFNRDKNIRWIHVDAYKDTTSISANVWETIKEI